MNFILLKIGKEKGKLGFDVNFNVFLAFKHNSWTWSQKLVDNKLVIKTSTQVVKDYSHPEVKKQQDEDKKMRLQVRKMTK
jgi:hypothetical protein